MKWWRALSTLLIFGGVVVLFSKPWSGWSCLWPYAWRDVMLLLGGLAALASLGWAGAILVSERICSAVLLLGYWLSETALPVGYLKYLGWGSVFLCLAWGTTLGLLWPMNLIAEGPPPSWD